MSGEEKKSKKGGDHTKWCPTNPKRQYSGFMLPLLLLFVSVAAALTTMIGHHHTDAFLYRAGGDTSALFLHHHAPTTSLIAMNRRKEDDRILVSILTSSYACIDAQRIRRRRSVGLFTTPRNYVEMEHPPPSKDDDDDDADDSFFVMASREAYRERIKRMRNTNMEDPSLPKAMTSASIGERLLGEKMLHEEEAKNSLLNSSSSTTTTTTTATTEKDNERLHRSLLETRLAYDAIDSGLLAAVEFAEPKPYVIKESIVDTTEANDGRSSGSRLRRTGGDDEEEQLHRSLLETRLAYEAIDSKLLAAVAAAEPKPYVIAESGSDDEAQLKPPKSSTIHDSVVSLLETLDEDDDDDPPLQQGRTILSSDGKELFEPSSSSMEVNEENVNTGLYVLTRSLVALKSILDK